MIADRLANAHLYRGLSPRLALGLDHLASTDHHRTPCGTHEIDGKRVYAIVQDYTTLPLAQCAWEAHRGYIDLQFVVSGSERIGHAHIARLLPGVYDAERDLVPLSGEGDYLTLGPGDFAVLFPEDAHMPRIALAAPGQVRKVVVKISTAP